MAVTVYPKTLVLFDPMNEVLREAGDGSVTRSTSVVLTDRRELWLEGKSKPELKK